jgi:hypothetical protein
VDEVGAGISATGGAVEDEAAAIDWRRRLQMDVAAAAVPYGSKRVGAWVDRPKTQMDEGRDGLRLGAWSEPGGRGYGTCNATHSSRPCASVATGQGSFEISNGENFRTQSKFHLF